MSVRYYKRGNISMKSVDTSRYIYTKLMVLLNISINKLLDIVKEILTNFCEAKVVGYNKNTNKYWCKMYDKNYQVSFLNNQ